MNTSEFVDVDAHKKKPLLTITYSHNLESMTDPEGKDPQKSAKLLQYCCICCGGKYLSFSTSTSSADFPERNDRTNTACSSSTNVHCSRERGCNRKEKDGKGALNHAVVLQCPGRALSAHA